MDVCWRILLATLVAVFCSYVCRAQPGICKNCSPGSVIHTGSLALCQCPAGISGECCKELLANCSDQPCDNYGLCNQTSTDLVECHCLTGTSGVSCSINADDCASNPCPGNATCRDGINNYTCQCNPGMTGIHCTEIDHCHGFVCHNNGVCVVNGTMPYCQCLQDVYYDDICLNTDPCMSTPCHLDATCTPVHSRIEPYYLCTCRAGLTGSTCNQDLNECLNEELCRNNGTCVNNHGSYSCSCKPGFTGSQCGTNVDRCASQPCVHGTCQDQTAAFSCSCAAGYTGVHCETSVNDCIEKGCHNGGTCVDVHNNFTCICALGYTGPLCADDVDECLAAPCQRNGTCDNYPGIYRCKCVSGFTGKHCSRDVDECSTTPCKHSSVCSNTVGSYTCACLAGTTGDDCAVDVNECSSSPCLNGGTCQQRNWTVSITSTYHCLCPPQYTGTRCETLWDDCYVDATHTHCLNGGTCHDQVGTFRCSCPAGYTGVHCETDVDECLPSPCLSGATCHDMVNAFQCTCPAGFTGSQCQSSVIDHCRTAPCPHHSSCTDTPSGYTCQCASGYTGVQCQIDINECASQPCRNGGQCSDLPGGFSCSCTGTRYAGDRCEISLCDRHCTADNTNKCIADTAIPNGVRCQCLSGYTGSSCDKETDECKPDPCHNGAVCEDKANDFKCKCAPGFMGKMCDVDEDECALLRPACVVGSCNNHHGSYSCMCPDGFSGSRCENNLDNCAAAVAAVTTSVLCQNGGSCIDGADHHTCICSAGFIGDECEKRNETVSADSICPSSCKSYSDNYCDQACNTAACSWDRMDCSLHFNPWLQCAHVATSDGKKCWEVFEDGVCNQECNCDVCNFDGRDCEAMERTCNDLSTCENDFNNEKCNENCNSLACGWDGGDCVDATILLEGELWMIVDVDVKHFTREFAQSLRYNFSKLLRGIVVIEANVSVDGKAVEEMVNELMSSAVESGSRSKRSKQQTNLLARYSGRNFTNVSMTLNVAPCKADPSTKDTCFIDVREVASFVSATAQVSKLGSDEHIISVGAATSKTNTPEKEPGWMEHFYKYGLPGIGTVLLVGVAATVVFKRKKRLRARTVKIFPEPSRKRASSGRKSPAGASACGQDSSMEMKDPKSPKPIKEGAWMTESNTEPISMHPGLVHYRINKPSGAGGRRVSPVGMSGDGADTAISSSQHSLRHTGGQTSSGGNTMGDPMTIIGKPPTTSLANWSTLHKQAASGGGVGGHLSGPILTPPSDTSSEDLDRVLSNVNSRGPDGITPLMLAACNPSQYADMKPHHAHRMMPPQSHLPPGMGNPLDPHGIMFANPMAMTAMTTAHSELFYGMGPAAPESFLQRLLTMGADCNARTYSMQETALHLAARCGVADNVNVLLHYGADPNAVDKYGASPLHAAVSAGATAVVQVLLGHEATNMDIQAEDGTTALMVAARSADEVELNAITDLLLRHTKPPHQSINAIDNEGRTALHWAAAVDNESATRLLLKYGAQKDAQNHKGETPLYMAAQDGSPATARVLLENFASRNILDNMEQSPLDIARKLHARQDIIQLLENMSIGTVAMAHANAAVTAAAMPTSVAAAAEYAARFAPTSNFSMMMAANAAASAAQEAVSSCQSPSEQFSKPTPPIPMQQRPEFKRSLSTSGQAMSGGMAFHSANIGHASRGQQSAKAFQPHPPPRQHSLLQKQIRNSPPPNSIGASAPASSQLRRNVTSSAAAAHLTDLQHQKQQQQQHQKQQVLSHSHTAGSNTLHYLQANKISCRRSPDSQDSSKSSHGSNMQQNLSPAPGSEASHGKLLHPRHASVSGSSGTESLSPPAQHSPQSSITSPRSAGSGSVSPKSHSDASSQQQRNLQDLAHLRHVQQQRLQQKQKQQVMLECRRQQQEGLMAMWHQQQQQQQHQQHHQQQVASLANRSGMHGDKIDPSLPLCSESNDPMRLDSQLYQQLSTAAAGLPALDGNVDAGLLQELENSDMMANFLPAYPQVGMAAAQDLMKMEQQLLLPLPEESASIPGATVAASSQPFAAPFSVADSYNVPAGMNSMIMQQQQQQQQTHHSASDSGTSTDHGHLLSSDSSHHSPAASSSSPWRSLSPQTAFSDSGGSSSTSPPQSDDSLKTHWTQPDSAPGPSARHRAPAIGAEASKLTHNQQMQHAAAPQVPLHKNH
eukprot:scpid7645/ scgid34528/ Neurogenic locus Notch protein; Processed neurogenic locus Notch protein